MGRKFRSGHAENVIAQLVRADYKGTLYVATSGYIKKEMKTDHDAIGCSWF